MPTIVALGVEPELVYLVGCQSLDRGRLLAPRDVFGVRRWLPWCRGRQRNDRHEPLGFVHGGERVHNEPVEPRIHGGVGADPERERQRGDGRESRRASQAAERDARILQRGIEQRPPAGAPDVLGVVRRVSELSSGDASGIVVREAVSLLLHSLELQMGAHFLLDVARVGTSAKEDDRAVATGVEPGHRDAITR